MDLNVLWFVLLGILLAGYAILDGFDLGVGMLQRVTRTDEERRIVLNSIGPLWDGNEVWLVTFGGALFAAFPEAYATIFSGLYEAFMLLLGALIFRAISIEFRGKLGYPAWRLFWDIVFGVSSFVATIIFGVSVGCAMTGIPLDERGIFRGTLASLLGAYPLLTAALTVALFTMHGAIFLGMKTTGELQARVRSWMWYGFWGFVVLYVAVTAMTIWFVPRSIENFRHFPWAWAIVVLNVLAIANIPRSLVRQKLPMAFASSSCCIAALVFLLGMALFPNLVTSHPRPEHSLTIYNAASSQGTLTIMAIIALIGMPFVLSYTAIVYWTFRGPVQLDKHSY